MTQRRYPASLATLLISLGLTTAAMATTGNEPVNPSQAETRSAAAPVDLSPVPERLGRSALPADWHHGAFIEIFVRGYQDSDGDGIGDLRGLIQRLDYLKELGVRGIWLMPITASADRDHGYATTDYRAIEPQYGTLDDFDALIREAHRRGIGVVMDYVINHSADRHPLFQAAKQDPSSPWRDWFVWTSTPIDALKDWDIWGQTPWYLPDGTAIAGAAEPSPQRYFATFGAQMPDFNMRHPDVVRYHADSLRFWLNRGLDGFRLDAVPHLIENNAEDWNDQPESRRLTGWFVQQIKRYPHRWVVCEATAEPKVYTRPEICGSAFAFGLERAVITAAKAEGEAGTDAVQQVARFFSEAPTTMSTMLSNHDIFAGRRAWDQFDGDEARYKLAAATYLLMPGTPFLYYGEEIGQAGIIGLPGDEPLRAPMSWTAEGGFSTGKPFRPLAPNVATHNAQAQAADPQSLLNFYKALLTLRNQQPALARGRYEAPLAAGHVLAFQRVWQRERRLVVLNYGTGPAELPMASLRAHAVLEPLWAAHTGQADSAEAPRRLRADARGSLTIAVPAQSVHVFRLR